MTKETLLEKTLLNVSKLPESKILQINEYIEFILTKYEEETLNKGIEKLVNDSQSFEFLNEEEDLYSENDLKLS